MTLISLMSALNPSPTAVSSAAGLTALPQLCVVQVSGADTITFLQGQLTQDVVTLPHGQARLAGYCNAKGRLHASMVICHGPNVGEDSPSLLLLLDSSLADALVKRLRMFVLRAKVELQRLDWQVTGVWSDQLQSEPIWSCQQDSETLQIVAPAATGSRAWRIHKKPQNLAADGQSLWQTQDIQAGLPWILASTFELFTPLMVNFDLIGGVSFTKGCYPGQEVVARSHYRGKQKRRTHRASLVAPAGVDVAAIPGQDICAPEAREPIGRVVNAAVHDGILELLFEAPLEMATVSGLSLALPDGPTLTLQSLPYDLASETH